MPESTLCSTETALPQFRDVTSPFDGRVIGAVSLTESSAGTAVIETARIGARKARTLSRNARGKILDGAATEIEQLAIQIIKEEEPLQHRLFRSIMRIPPVRRFSAAVKYSPAMLSQRSTLSIVAVGLILSATFPPEWSSTPY